MLRTCVEAAKVDGSVCVFLEPIALYHTRDLYEDGDDRWLAPASGDAALGAARVYGDGADLTILMSAECRTGPSGTGIPESGDGRGGGIALGCAHLKKGGEDGPSPPPRTTLNEPVPHRTYRGCPVRGGGASGGRFAA